MDIYGPFLYRYGRKRGMQDADALDLTQDVLREVSSCIQRFRYDASIGKFRNWLMVIARYQFFQRTKKRVAIPLAPADLADVDERTSEEFDEQWEREYQLHLFYWAAEQVKETVSEKTWDAFWMTAMDGRSASEVASKLGMRLGSVYVAKSRMLLRIRELVEQIDGSTET